MLTGAYSPDKILAIANTDWDFRNRFGRPLARTTLYYMLTNPFYAGSFEYPLASGQWYQGKHEPMVTEAEYERVQALLGRKGNPRAVKRTFAYTGLIRCGHCGAMVTAEEKRQLICGACRYKFVPRGKDRCPSCSTPIQRMLAGKTPRRPIVLHYVYYHCTKRIDRTCPERAVRVEELEADLANYLERLDVSEAFQRWVVTQLRRVVEAEGQNLAEVRAAQERAHTACVTRLDNLVQLKTAPENIDGSLLSDAEYARQRADLLNAKRNFEKMLQQTATPAVDPSSLVGEIFDFARHARTWLRAEDLDTKRLLLAASATTVRT
jgi:site-specific DNA recombinase